MRRIGGLLDVDAERAAFEPNGVAPHWLVSGAAYDVSGRHVELASMARAGDDRRFEIPLGERAPLMRAGVPERVEGATDVCDRDPALADVLETGR